MSGAFAGKTIAITGAAGGIGQWLCRFFGAEGATIAALDRSDKVNDLVDALGKDGINVKPAVADIAIGGGREGSLRRLRRRPYPHQQRRRLAPPDARVTDPAGWEEDIAANLNGAYACAHAVLPQMVARKSGTSSMSARSTACVRWAIPPTVPPRPA